MKRSFFAALSLLVFLCGCSGDPAPRDRGSAGMGFENPIGGSGAGSAGTGTGGGNFGNPLAGTGGGIPSGGTGGVIMQDQTVDASFIWIANSAEGTVSKLDTRTMVELARYQTRPDGMGRPSRTSVGDNGDVVVANRDGGVTKIFANSTMCPDKNANGTIETSTGRDNVLPWGEDECVAWHTPISHWSNRPIAWSATPAPDAPAKIWTAGALPPGGAGCGPTDCTIDVFRLNGETGVIEDTINITGLSGTDFIGTTIPFGGVLIENYGPYGGASDAGGNFWVFVGNTTQLIRVDAVTLEYRIWPVEPAGNGYGITIDEKGRVFVCGTLGLSRFDPATETWMTSPGGPVLGFNGCMTDGAGKIWVGGGSDFGDAGLHGYDAETLMHITSYPVGGVKGVSIDIDGFVWGVGSPGAFVQNAANGNTAWRVDPMTGEVMMYDGLSGAYSYSDMTGFGLASAGVILPPD
jgi:hypothetical protein